jgi:hypothetical protein
MGRSTRWLIPIPDGPPDAPESFLSDEELDTMVQDDVTVEALTEALEELTDTEVVQVLEAILEDEPTQEQAILLTGVALVLHSAITLGIQQ